MLQTDLSSFSYKKGSLLPVCKRCGKEHFYRDGKNKAGIQRYKCRSCGFRFVWTSDLPRRNFFSCIMTFAVEIYTSLRMAASLRGVKQILKKAFNVSVSHEAIRQWVLDSKLSIDDNCVSSKTWHADETYFKIKGKGYWLWIVRCKESGHVIAWNITKSHLLKDARFVMQKALEQSKGARPEKIITDGLWQYPVAIYKTMRWSWAEQKEKHIIDSGIGKNYFIERLNREIKRRLKWFSTFQALAGAKAFFGLWFYHHNTHYLT
jgi:transposase-like protein/DNA-directed RNA polymerase subunit RPC12/RpoP